VISDRARTLDEEKEMKVGGAGRGERRVERKRDGGREGRERRCKSRGGGRGENGGRGIEERNQRRLSAYEVGIVGWRRLARSLRIARRWARS